MLPFKFNAGIFFHVFSDGIDARELASSTSKRLTIVPCDVTSDEAVKKAQTFVNKKVTEENLGMSSIDRSSVSIQGAGQGVVYMSLKFDLDYTHSSSFLDLLLYEA